MKKFLILISILICSILLFVNFSQYLYLFEVDKATKDELFQECETHINFNNFTLTADEYNKQLEDRAKVMIKQGFEDNEHLHRPVKYSADILKTGEDDDKKLVELALSLGDKVDSKYNKSFWGIEYNKDTDINYEGYYDYKGSLLFVQKIMWLGGAFGYCRYNSNNKLIEAAYRNNELYYAFTPNKSLIYRCYRGICSENLVKYKKQN